MTDDPHPVPSRLRCFLSYSRHDTAMLERVCEGLRALDIDPVYDTASAEPGADWQMRLLRLMRYCHYCIPLISLNSLMSDTCRWEWDEAERVGLRLFPAIIDATPPEHLPGRFRRLHLVSMADTATAAEATGRIARAMMADASWSETLTVLTQVAEAAANPGRGLDKAIAEAWPRNAAHLTGNALIRAETWARERPEHVPNLPAAIADFITASRTEEDARLARTITDAGVQIMAQAYRSGNCRGALDGLMALTIALHRDAAAPCPPLDLCPLDLDYLVKSCTALDYGLSCFQFPRVLAATYLPGSHSVLVEAETVLDPRRRWRLGVLAEWSLHRNEVKVIEDPHFLWTIRTSGDRYIHASRKFALVSDRSDSACRGVIRLEDIPQVWGDGEVTYYDEEMYEGYFMPEPGRIIFSTDNGRVCLADYTTSTIVGELRPEKAKRYYGSSSEILTFRVDAARDRCSFVFRDAAFLCQITGDDIIVECRVDDAYTGRISNCGQYWLVWRTPDSMELYVLRDGHWHVATALHLSPDNDLSFFAVSPGSRRLVIRHRSLALSLWSLPDLAPISCRQLEGLNAVDFFFVGDSEQLWVLDGTSRLHLVDLADPDTHHTVRTLDPAVERCERLGNDLISLIKQGGELRLTQADRIAPVFYRAASADPADWAIVPGFDGVLVVANGQLRFRSFAGGIAHPVFDDCRRFVVIDEEADAVELIVDIRGRWRRARLLADLSGEIGGGFGELARLAPDCRIIALTPDLFAAISADGDAHIVSTADNRILFTLADQQVSHVTATPDGGRVVFAVKEGGIRCFGTRGFEKKWDYHVRWNYGDSNEKREIRELLVSPDGKYLHVGYVYYKDPRPLITWPRFNYHHGTCLLAVEGGSSVLHKHTAISCPPDQFLYLDGRSLLIGDRDSIWKDDKPARTILRCVDEELDGLVGDRAVEQVAFFDRRSVVSVTEVANGAIIAQWDFRRRGIARLEFSSCARYLAIVFADGGLEIFRIPAGIDAGDAGALLVRHALSGGGRIALPLSDVFAAREIIETAPDWVLHGQSDGHHSIAAQFLACFPQERISNAAPFRLDADLSGSDISVPSAK